MLRAILKYHRKDDPYQHADRAGFWTLDFDCQELEDALLAGGVSQNGYEFHELIGVEVLRSTGDA